MSTNLTHDLHDIADACVDSVLRTPQLAAMLAGTANLETLAEWTAQTYWYVRATVPSLALAAAHLERSGKYPELVAYVQGKCREEDAHDTWVLRDRGAAGLSSRPEELPPASPAVTAYVAFNRAMILSGSPVAYLGTAFLLETLAERLAGVAATRLVSKGALPAGAVGFLKGHADADPHHVDELVAVLERIDDPADAEAIRLCARVTGALYPRFFAVL